MDRAIIEEYLAKAEGRATRGEQHLRRQRATVDRLRRKGWDSIKAEEILVGFELAQTTHLAALERLREQLAAAP